MPLLGAAPSAGTRAARDESLTAVPGRIHGVAVRRNRDTLGCGCSSAAITARRPRQALTSSHLRPRSREMIDLFTSVSGEPGAARKQVAVRQREWGTTE
jgi:hypothetical protein